MTAILLWSPRFDAFDLYTEPEPPDGESGEVVEPVGAGEGHAVVGTDGAWLLRDNQGLIRKFGAGWPTRLLEA